MSNVSELKPAEPAEPDGDFLEREPIGMFLDYLLESMNKQFRDTQGDLRLLRKWVKRGLLSDKLALDMARCITYDMDLSAAMWRAAVKDGSFRGPI